MGDSACVMPHTFPYASGLSNEEANQKNPLHSLGESVSFGRFMSESLAWEKWSTFSQNRHVEEAERFAQPGSVAQKKAFFEAHYKKIAAKKAAEALLQQENADSNALEPGDKSGECRDSETITINASQVVADDRKELKNNKENAIISTDEHNSSEKAVDLENGNEGGGEIAKKSEFLVENPTNVESLNQNVEPNGTPQVDKYLLKDDVTQTAKKRRPVLASLKSTVFRKVTFTPAKSMVPLYLKKENYFTPSTMESTMDPIDKKRSNPKSLRKFINFTPAREADILSSPLAKKIESSRIAPTFYKASKDCATPLTNPNMASVNGVPGHPSTTPSSVTERSNTSVDPLASGSKTTGPKWHLISSVCSKSFSACRKKLQSSTLSTPFVLRTEERAARRKQKLEERFNEKEAQKDQIQTKLKEKSERDDAKMNQMLCFRARPLPEFYRRQTKKTPEMHPDQSSKLGVKPDTSKLKNTKPLTKPSTSKALKNVLNKKK